MRAIWGRLALLLGAFTLVASGVVVFWGSDAAHRIPIGVDNFTYLTGTGSGLLAKSDTAVDVTNATLTRADPEASTNDVVAMSQFGCVATGTEFCLDKKGNVIFLRVTSGSSASATRSTPWTAPPDTRSRTRRSTSRTRTRSSPTRPGDQVPLRHPEEGLPVLGRHAADHGHRHVRRHEGDPGVETYQFDVDVPKTTAEISEGTQGTYESHQTLWVEPKTGAYIDQSVKQAVGLPDGTVVFDADLRYTADTVTANADDAKGNIRLLWILDVFMKWIAPVIGIVLIVVGIVVLRKPRKQDTSDNERELTTV